MKRTSQERILNEVFDDNALASARAASLSAGLQAMRRRRQQRIAFASLSGLLACAAGVALWFRQTTISPPLPPVNVTAPVGEFRGVKIITDAELLALFRDRQVALIGAPGEQQLVFLDESARPARHE